MPTICAVIESPKKWSRGYMIVLVLNGRKQA